VRSWLKGAQVLVQGTGYGHSYCLSTSLGCHVCQLYVLHEVLGLTPGSQHPMLCHSCDHHLLVPAHAVQPEWLAASGTPLAVFSAPLPDPGPTYRPHPVDAVLAWHEVTYGRHEWPLPRCLRPHPDPKTKAAVFGAALLEGRVVPGFAGEQTPGVGSCEQCQS
jgi:hypothetical protein